MGMADKLKRDLGRNRGKAAVLGVLFVAMVALSVRAVLQLRPRAVQAAVDSGALADAPDTTLAAGLANAQDRIKEGQGLWRRLRQVTPDALDVGAAFKFDASVYPPPPVDLTRRVPLAPPVAPEVIEPVKPQPIPLPVDEEALKAARIREQANGLMVQSIGLGNGSGESKTIINRQLLKVGQSVLGFEITDIREREVEVQKEGITTVIRMPTGQNK